jgi:hypothetical protein
MLCIIKQQTTFSTKQRAYLPAVFQIIHIQQVVVSCFHRCGNSKKVENSTRCLTVYIIELSKDVLFEGKLKKCNPGYILGKPCVYVGMTGLNPDVRFDKHKAGIQSNRYVKQYGLRLLPDLY